MRSDSLAIAIFNTHDEAEEAIKSLQAEGFDMKKLSIVGKDYHTEETVVGYASTGDRILTWGKFGAFWGALLGAFMGSGFFFIPVLGPVLIAGPLLSTFIGALEGATVIGGLNAIGAALFSIGIPKNSILKYETAIKSDKFLLIVHGNAAEVASAKALLSQAEDMMELTPVTQS
jgi:uncharacterized membrane protein